jgi:membrane-bound serine protease (ClpP class)
VAEAMVRESRSLTAHEALDQKIIQSLSETPAQFLDAVDGLKVRVEGTGGEVILKTRGAHLIEIPMTLGQKLLHFLADPNVATLLMSLGGLLIYVEVANPGITIAGVLGAICLITGFMSFQLLPIRTGGLLLFALGLLMFILEAVVTSHGALAVGGILSLVLGIVWIMDPAAGALRIEPQVWIPTILVLSSCVLLISFAASRTQKLVEKVLKKMKGGGLAGLKGYEGTVEWVDPSHPERGRILIRGEVWAAVSLAGALSVGQKVEVERVEGFTVWVK